MRTFTFSSMRTAIAIACMLLPAEAYAASSMGIVTGPTTGTYFITGRDISDIAKKAGIGLEVKPSEGSIDNIKRINSNENAALGIVQSDVLGFLSRSKNPESVRMAGNLRMIYPFYTEEVHVLARKNIKSFKDLTGKKVAIGEDGSGNMLTAVNLFSMMQVTPKDVRKVSPTMGVVAVLKGELDAAIFVGGKPVRLFKNLEDLRLPENQQYNAMLEKVHFLPLNEPKMLEEYRPAEITPADYTFVKESVPTIAVQAVMISFNFSENGNKARCEQLGTLAKAIREALPKLKETGHPKWREVNLDAKVAGWKKDACAWPEAAAAEQAPAKTPAN
jgi:uncharacterized protein